MVNEFDEVKLLAQKTKGNYRVNELLSLPDEL